MKLGAIVLTGGASTRMGTDKAALVWFGQRAVDRVVELALLCAAEPVMTVGSQGYGPPHLVDSELSGGPVGGIMTGRRALLAAGCTRALILAVDAPMLSAFDLAPLLASGAPGAAYEGLHLPMIIDLTSFPDGADAGWPLARLIERAGLARVWCSPDSFERIRGANTIEEWENLQKVP